VPLVAYALLIAAAAEPAGEPLRPWAGGETPALEGVLLSDEPLRLASYRGRVVVVHFWATWCEPCRTEMPLLSRLRSQDAGRPLEVLSVNYGEGVKRISDFLKAFSIDLKVVRDPDHRLARAWGVGGLPMTFLVDATGRIRFSVFGAERWDEGEAARALDRLLSEAEKSDGSGPDSSTSAR
jgi:thiol-disulfide isomerase/thioredoxin